MCVCVCVIVCHCDNVHVWDRICTRVKRLCAGAHVGQREQMRSKQVCMYLPHPGGVGYLWHKAGRVFSWLSTHLWGGGGEEGATTKTPLPAVNSSETPPTDLQDVELKGPASLPLRVANLKLADSSQGNHSGWDVAFMHAPKTSHFFHILHPLYI